MFQIRVSFASRGFLHGEVTEDIFACSIDELGKAIKERSEDWETRVGFPVLSTIFYETLICGRKGDPDEIERLANFFT